MIQGNLVLIPMDDRTLKEFAKDYGCNVIVSRKDANAVRDEHHSGKILFMARCYLDGSGEPFLTTYDQWGKHNDVIQDNDAVYWVGGDK